MNHPYDLPTADVTQEEIAAIAALWGWEHPSASTAEAIRESVMASKSRSGEYLIKIGAIEEAAVARLLATMPPGRRTLDWISENRRDTLPYVDRYLAFSESIAYYHTLDDFSLHGVMELREVVSECDSGEQVVLATDRGTPVIVFSNINAYYRYKSLGRAERHKSPLNRQFQMQGIRHVLFAVSRRDLVSALLNYARTEVAGKTVTAESAAVWLGGSEETRSHPEMRELSRIMDTALKNQATDISLDPLPDGSATIRMRQFGDLRIIGTASLPPEIAEKAIAFLKTRSGANTTGTRLLVPADGHMAYRSPAGEAQMRLSFIPLNHPGEVIPQVSVSIRIFKREQMDIDMLKLNLDVCVVEELRYAVQLSQGLIVLAGPTNSGKSTTIGGGVSEHWKIYGDTRKRLSVEDPVEQILRGITQIQVPTWLPEEERWTLLTRALKRHDPDLLWLGEVRDGETAKACATYASSGHVVLSTVHAKDTLVGCDVLAKMVPTDVRFQLAESMQLMVSQRLMKQLCPKCRQVRCISDDERRLVERYAHSQGERNYTIPEMVAEAVGCQHCVAGYSALLPINELLPFTREVRDAWQVLLERADPDARRVMSEARMLTLLQSALTRVANFEMDIKSVLV